MFKVVTEDGTTVYKGKTDGAEGVTEEQAKASADERNERAEQMGLQTRYKVEAL